MFASCWKTTIALQHACQTKNIFFLNALGKCPAMNRDIQTIFWKQCQKDTCIQCAHNNKCTLTLIFLSALCGW